MDYFCLIHCGCSKAVRTSNGKRNDKMFSGRLYRFISGNGYAIPHAIVVDGAPARQIKRGSGHPLRGMGPASGCCTPAFSRGWTSLGTPPPAAAIATREGH